MPTACATTTSCAAAWTRAWALTDLCAKMGLTLADAVAAGDSANDVGMLKAAGLAAAWQTAPPDAKAAADRIIGDVREDGVAALIEELWFDGPKRSPPAATLALHGAILKAQADNELCTGVQ